MEELGIDFEEGFSDDDDINFGMDDQEEAKEAKKRIFGKGVAGEVDHDTGVWKDSTARVFFLISICIFCIIPILADRKESCKERKARSIYRYGP